MKHRIINNSLALGLIQIANYIIPFVLLIYLGNLLGADLYGYIALSHSIMVLSFVLTDFGFSLSATNKISKFRTNKSFIAELIGGIIVIKLIVYALCSLIFLPIIYFSGAFDEHELILILTMFPIFTQCFTPLWFFQGIEKMKYIAAFMIFSKAFYLFLVFILIKNTNDYYMVPVFNGIAQFLGLIIAVCLIYKLGYFIKKPRLRLVRYAYNASIKFFFSRLAVTSYMSTGVLILGIFVSSSAAAVYSVAEQLYNALKAITGSFASAIYPFMSKEKDIILMKKIIFITALGSASLACVSYIISPFIIDLVFDEEWKKSIDILNIFFISFIIHSICVMCGYPLFAALERLDTANISVNTGALIYIFMCFFAIYFQFITPIFLVFSMMCAESAVLVHRYLVFRPILKKINGD
jgi:polysaccharide transporter, PST family